jgi:glycosyltransferase involved in cell wall biosynthesis
MKFSVVIPTYNRPLLLARCLVAVMSQSFDKKLYEIIVVDDGNNKETKRIVDMWRQFEYPKVRYISMSEQSGPAKARNIGWESADGDIIAFTDDDCIPTEDWLSAGFEAFSKNTAAITGKLIVPTPTPPTDYEKNTAHLSVAEFVTANCFIKKTDLQEIGGFDETFTMAWREDSDMQFKLLENHKKIIKQPKAIVVHPVRSTSWGVSIKEQKKSMFNPLLYKKHPELYEDKIQSSPPWKYYGILLSFVATLTSVYTHQSLLTLLFFGVWIALTSIFILERLEDTAKTPSHILEMITTSFIIPFLSIFWRLFGAVKYRVFFL